MTTTPHAAPPLDLVGALAELATAPQPDDGHPNHIAVGTFAIYPTPAGGVVLVVNVDDAPAPELLGTHTKKVGPAAIRAAAAMGESSNIFNLAKNVMRRRRGKE